MNREHIRIRNNNGFGHKTTVELVRYDKAGNEEVVDLSRHTRAVDLRIRLNEFVTATLEMFVHDIESQAIVESINVTRPNEGDIDVTSLADNTRRYREPATPKLPDADGHNKR